MVNRRPFEHIVREHGPTVLRVCRAMIIGPAAEDAWSETFLSALRAYPDLDENANVEAWLVTIARRKAIDQHRIAVRHRPVVASQECAAPVQSTSFDHEDLWTALRTLPPTQRDAIVHHHLAGLPYAQVAELLGNSEPAARRAAADGMQRLRAIYRSDTIDEVSNP